jgi:hypothetical protein
MKKPFICILIFLLSSFSTSPLFSSELITINGLFYISSGQYRVEEIGNAVFLVTDNAGAWRLEGDDLSQFEPGASGLYYTEKNALKPYILTDRNRIFYFANQGVVSKGTDATKRLKAGSDSDQEAITWSRLLEKSDGFQIEFPCNPQKKQMKWEEDFIKTARCEETINGGLLLFQITWSGKTNGHPIEYAQNDLSLALKNYAIDNLLGYGANPGNIRFSNISKLLGEYPAIYYYANELRGGSIAEGISCLVKGKHYKIGVVYESVCQVEAKARVIRFLSSYKVK